MKIVRKIRRPLRRTWTLLQAGLLLVLSASGVGLFNMHAAVAAEENPAFVSVGARKVRWQAQADSVVYDTNINRTLDMSYAFANKFYVRGMLSESEKRDVDRSRRFGIVLGTENWTLHFESGKISGNIVPDVNGGLIYSELGTFDGEYVKRGISWGRGAVKSGIMQINVTKPTVYEFAGCVTAVTYACLYNDKRSKRDYVLYGMYFDGLRGMIDIGRKFSSTRTNSGSYMDGFMGVGIGREIPSAETLSRVQGATGLGTNITADPVTGLGVMIESEIGYFWSASIPPATGGIALGFYWRSHHLFAGSGDLKPNTNYAMPLDYGLTARVALLF